MAMTITGSNYKVTTETDVCPDLPPLSCSMDRGELKKRFGKEIDGFTAHERANGASRGAMLDHRRQICHCLWILCLKRNSVSVRSVSKVDLTYIRNELETRHEKFPVSHIRTFAAFISFVTGKPSLIDTGKFGAKLSGDVGSLVTSDEIGKTDAKHKRMLDEVGLNERSDGLSPQTVWLHRRRTAVCIVLLERMGVSVPDGVTEAHLDTIQNQLSETGIKDASRYVTSLTEFLACFGNKCRSRKTVRYGKQKTDWTAPYRTGFRFEKELEQYRIYLVNRGLSEMSVETKISRVRICSRVFDSVAGEVPLRMIDLQAVTKAESVIGAHISEVPKRKYLCAFFDFAGYFGVPDLYSELLRGRRSRINYHPKTPQGEKFLAKLKE